MSDRFLVWHQFLCKKDLLIPTFCTFLVASHGIATYLFIQRKKDFRNPEFLRKHSSVRFA